MRNKEAVKKLLGLLKDYRKIIALIIACLLISTGLNMCIPLLNRGIMDYGFIGGDKELLIKQVICSLLIYMIIAVIDIIKEKKRVDISANIQYSLSEQSFKHLMKIKADYFTNRNYAEILNNINVDIGNMTSIADEGVFFVVTQAFSMVGGIIGLFILDYRMTLMVLLFIPVKAVIMKHFAKKRKRIMDEFITESEKYAGWFGDTVGGVREVKLFGILENKRAEFADRQLSVFNKQKKMNMLAQWNGITDNIIVHLLTSLIYIIGANLVFDMQLSVGSVFAFITYSAYVTGPISAILNIGYLLSGIIPSAKRYYEFMALEEEKENEESMTEPCFGDLELQNLSFSYEKDKAVLSDVNISFPKGSKTVLIGRNGSGKSTLISLLLQLYQPTSGKITLCGTDISELVLKDYRNMVSVVSQDIYLFNSSIRDNICMYKDIDDKFIMEACKDSGLADFISEVSLDYVVGQNGAMLSGGQKQKIALARALVHNSPVIIFDEATSNTDVYSEHQINGLLHTKLKEKTVIIITHKQEILKEADQIIMLKDGAVVGSGVYDDLSKDNLEFKNMLNMGEKY